nr:hypothetical protein [uncultured Psychroserpens sp.]
MEPATWGFIGTIVGTIVGASASLFATYLNGKNSLNIQKGTEKFKREEIAREFQRDNLLKLQDEFASGMRLIGKAHIESFRYHKKHNDWKGFRFSDEIDSSLTSMYQSLMKLTERVRNDKLRQSIIDIRKDMSNMRVYETEAENDQYIGKLAEKYELLMEEIGIELRNNYK